MTRAQRLSEARLYLVTDASPGGRPLDEVLRAALRGGVDVVQLRDKATSDEEILAAAAVARAACAETGALFFVNDRPDLARAAGADGVHVGQDDMAVSRARDIVGASALVGLSTHAPHEIDRADAQGADYIGVGPVHATPTKPGRPAVGLELVEHAAAATAAGTLVAPWFAIGGIDPVTVGAVVGAGARRIVVVRAITEVADPEGAARALLAALPQEALHG